MRRVVSLFLPHLSVERLQRMERPTARPPEPRGLIPTVDDDPGPCSAPRGGGWRPGARWATKDDRDHVERQIAELPTHARPPMRELGRRSEAAQHPFKASTRPDHTGEATIAGTVIRATAMPERRPLALSARTGRRDEIVARCAAAADLGVMIGMAATHARALVADLDLRPAEPEADMALLERLARLALRHWSPVAAVSPPDGIWLDIAGCAHLHGDEARFCKRLVALCERAGFTARVAVADTPGAAHALARFGSSSAPRIVPANTTTAALMPLPIAALRLNPTALVAARRFGFETVADLLPVARGPLARRLGLSAVTRLDQALGSVFEPITPIADPDAPLVERRLLEPIGTADPIEQVMRDLLADMVELLRTSGLGVRSLRLVAFRIDGGEQIVAVGTSRPTRDALHLLRLMRLRIERIDPGMGLERFCLLAVHVEPLDAVALGTVLTDDATVADPARLVDVVAGRIGPAAVFRLAPVDSHVPERAVCRIDPVATPGRWPSWPRPVRLLARPEPLSAVIALLPDHPPRRFDWRGHVHAIVAGDGPERIHGEWWRRDAEVWGARDYYRVEDEHGARFWVFRRGDGIEPETGDLSWWMHGLFA